MKKIITLFFILNMVVEIRAAQAQCNTEILSNASISKLTGGFNFVKSYKIDGVGNVSKVEYSYVFTKGTQYMVAISEENANANTILLTIFDANRNKVASNKIDGSLLSAVAYLCNATGIYYLQYTFEGPSPRCGGSVLGFKR